MERLEESQIYIINEIAVRLEILNQHFLAASSYSEQNKEDVISFIHSYSKVPASNELKN